MSHFVVNKLLVLSGEEEGDIGEDISLKERKRYREGRGGTSTELSETERRVDE